MDHLPDVEITKADVERLGPLLRGVPEEQKPEAARRLLRYLHLVIKIADESQEMNWEVTPQDPSIADHQAGHQSHLPDERQSPQEVCRADR